MMPDFIAAYNAARSVLIEHNARKLPIDILKIIKNTPNVSYVKAVELCDKKNINIDEFIIECMDGSVDGIVKYDGDKKYLIIYDTGYTFSPERDLFTLAHEFGHIKLGHFQVLQSKKISRSGNNANDPLYSMMEKEANCFASNLLAPSIVLQNMHATNTNEIMDLCRLSHRAASIKQSKISNYRYKATYKNNVLLNNFRGFITDYHSRDSLYALSISNEEML